MVGARIREKRQAQQRSLADVAGQAGISVATLSRIETDKQTLDLALFVSLARVLKTSPHEFLDGDQHGRSDRALAREIASLAPRDRAQLWQNLAAERRTIRSQSRRAADHQLGLHVEELIAQLDFLREELEAVKKRLRRR